MRSIIFLFLLVAVVSSAVMQLNTRHRRASVGSRRKSNKLYSGSAPLSDTYQLSVNLTLGTPPQTITVDIESSDGDFSLYNPCGAGSSCNVQGNVFAPQHSTTFGCDLSGNDTSCLRDSGYGFPDVWNGNMGHDVLSLAGFTVPLQAFEMYLLTGGDGVIMGTMGLGILDPYLYTSTLNNLLPQLDAPLFTVYMNHDHTGLLTMGAVDGKNCQAAVQYVPLSVPTKWQVKVTRFSFGGYMDVVPDHAEMTVGSYEIGVPTDVFPYILRFTKARRTPTSNGKYVVDCATRDTLPPLVFTLGGYDFTIESKYYTTEPLADLGGQCELAIYGYSCPVYASCPGFYIGDAFFTPYCGVFDVGNKRMGFAPSIQT